MLDGRLPENLTEDLNVTEFEIGGARFVISKLPAMPAFALLEEIRREVGRRSSALAPDDAGGAGTAGLLQLVLDLEPQFVDRVRRKLFENVVFANETARTPQPLAGAEDIAFEGLEPLAVYEVLLRCLAVNFSASLRGVVSRLNALGWTSIPSTPSGSRPSSPES